MKQLYLRNLVAVFMLFFFTHSTFGRDVKKKGNYLDESPVITVADITAFTRDDRCSAVVNSYGASASAPSGIKSLTFNFAEGSVFFAGVTEVIARAEDNAGNVSLATFNITVIDNVAPTLSIPDLELFLDENGQASLSNFNAPQVLFLDDFEDDNEGRNLETLERWNITSGNVDVFSGGEPSLLITNNGLDLAGNAAAEIETKEAFQLTPGNYRLRIDYHGNTGETSYRVQIGDVLDDSITEFVNEFYEPAEFDFVVTESMSASIRISEFGGGDVEKGTIIDNVRLLRQPDFSVNDNCQVTSITASQTDFTPVDLGVNTVTVTVSDVAGNTASQDIIVSVRDTIPPVITVADITAFTRDDRCSAVVENYNVTITDASGIQIQSFNFQEGTVFPAGVTQVTVFARDNAGNVATDSFTVTVIDNVVPTLEVSDMQVFLDENGQASLSDISAPELIFFEDFEEDETGRDLTTLSNWDVLAGNVDVFNGRFSSLPVTTNILNLAGTENATIESIESVTLTPGNYRLRVDYQGITTEDASFRVQIGDVLDDSITEFLNEFFEPAEFDFVVTETTTAPIRFTEFGGGDDPRFGTIIDNVRLLRQPDFSVYDNCQVTSITATQSDFTSADLGNNQITIEVSDAAGNTALTDIQVLVRDTIPPVITVDDITAFTRDDRCSAVVNNYGAIATDASGISRLTFNFVEGSVFSTGVTTVIARAEDNAGNVSFETFNVTVIDNVVPTLSVGNMELFLDENGQASLPNFNAPQVLFLDDFEGDDEGRNLEVLENWNVLSGNVDIFRGGQRPLLITNKGLDLAGDTSAEIETKETLQLEPGNYRLRVDYHGNAGEASFSVKIGDVLDDSITEFVNEFYEPAEFDFVVTESTNANIRISEFGGGDPAKGTIIDNVRLLRQPDFSIYDNCQVTSITASQTDFTCDNIGFNPVTITVADAAGNTASAEILVEVKDVTTPTVITNNITIDLDGNGNAAISAEDINNGSFDNCRIAKFSINKSRFDCNDLGVNIVTLTVTDINGNVSRGNATVRVRDVTAPRAIARNITVRLGANGTVKVDPRRVGSLSRDNCGIVSYRLSRDTFSCRDVQSAGRRNRGQRVLLTVTDAAGNSSRAIAFIRVIDATPPRAIARNITVRLGANGTVKVDPRQVGLSSRDNCRIVRYRLSKDTFTCKDVSNNGRGQRVTLTVTDAAGNSSRATAFIRVLDRTRPVISSAPITLIVREGRSSTLNRTDVINAVSDNCGIRSVNFSRRQYTTRNVGINRVSVTATDNSGNRTTGQIRVNVVDLDRLGNIVNMCYRGRSIRVRKAQVELWLRRGAELGSCRATFSQAGGLENEQEIQVEAEIQFTPEIKLSSYPNPTSGYTVINFSSSIAGAAKVMVMNINGIPLVTLFDEEVDANQEVEIGYETSQLPNGVYVVRLATAGGVKTLKLLVRK